jgi:hypothetical protein
MGRRIRWLGVVLLLCFGLVIVQLVNVQFAKAPALRASPNNPKNAAKAANNPRGAIYASDGTTLLAESVRANGGAYDYTRQYPGGGLYSQIVGFDSTFEGTSGVEYEYNSDLKAHPKPAQNLSQALGLEPGYGQLGVSIGARTLAKQAALFGYNSHPPIDLPNSWVATPTFPPVSALTPPDQELLADSAIGQYNDETSALSDALGAAGIANNGAIMTPLRHVPDQRQSRQCGDHLHPNEVEAGGLAERCSPSDSVDETGRNR